MDDVSAQIQAVAHEVGSAPSDSSHQDILSFGDNFFGPNTLHVPSITDVPGTESIVGLNFYKTRIVGLLSSRQHLILPKSQMEAALELAAYFRRLGISDFPDEGFICIPDGQHITETILNSPDILRRLERLPGSNLEAFIISPRVAEIARRLGRRVRMSHEVADILNDKVSARQLLDSQKIPTPGGIHVLGHGSLSDRVKSAARELFSKGHTEIGLTVPCSCSGQGIRRAISLEEVDDLMQSDLAREAELLIEPWLREVVASPSFQMSIGESSDEDQPIGCTDQLLDGLVHQGNEAPSSFMDHPAFVTLRARLLQVLRQSGARGILGVDVITVREACGSVSFFVTEINARHTGAIFGALLARRVRRGRVARLMCHNNINVPRGITLAEYTLHLQRQGIHWQPDATEGVLIVSNGNLINGKAMVVILADSKERVDEMFELASMEI